MVNEGAKVAFKCLASSENVVETPGGSFYLFQDKKIVQVQPNVENLRLGVFKLKHIVVEQAGRYSCAYGLESQERLGDVTNENSVNLTIKESQVLLDLKLVKKNSAEGIDVEFICSFPEDSGIRNIQKGLFELRWDGELLSSQYLTNSSEVTFSIVNVNENNDGNYVCVFRLGEIYAVKSPPVKLQYSALQFSLLLEVEQSPKGKDVTFACLFPGENRISHRAIGTFELHRDGVLLASQPMKGLTAALFKMKNINKTGTYVCVFRLGTMYTFKSEPVILQFTGINNTKETQGRTETYFLPNVIRLILSAVVGLVLLFFLCNACGNKR
ncbi:uncharacterized protein LOC120536372 [Polypterus senegalus]|uniref:uncharacterized protein LOC120536372 n=1 Tax=Polypterus senegalus TaxID=55291 RepID=UPI0019669BBE|nr:uncharacterized protein LOC120536372 [Polypterus senegalus]